jgi:AcrR family transcriptional regulator
MARPRDLRRREDLLAAVVGVLADGGIGKRSLRDVASAVGVSHRTLMHHFESREGLLVAVVEEVEARQRQRLRTIYSESPDVLDVLWADLTSRELRPFERLFFECYARGAAGEVPFDRMHPDAVESWLAIADDRGVDPTVARLALAVVRGLLLDLVATDDAVGATRALHLFAERLGDEARSGRSAQPPRRPTG